MARKIHPKFFGKIKESKIVFDRQNKEYLDGYIDTFIEDQEVEVTVKNRFKKRTSKQPGEETNQNGYYWGVPIRIIMDELGDQFTKKEVHDWIQIKVGNTKVMPDGQEVAIGTSEMSKGRFEEYCSEVRAWCSIPENVCEKGLYIPEPYEVEYEE